MNIDLALKTQALAHMEAAKWTVADRFKNLYDELAKSKEEKTEDEIIELVESFKPFSINLMGEAGIGKTAIVKSVATDLHIPVYVFNPSQWVDNSDIQGMPFKVMKDGRERTILALPEFFPDYVRDEEGNHVFTESGDLMVNFYQNKNYIANYRKVNQYYLEKYPEKYAKNPEMAINEAGACMVFFDELNRVVAEDVKQALFQVFIEMKLTNYEFPVGTTLVAASNPNTTDYSVSPIFEERAFKDRFVHLTVETSLADFNAYAKKINMHWSIISHVNAQPESLITKGEEYNLDIAPSPRSWEFVNTLVKFTNFPNLDRDVFTEAIAGVVGLEHATAYMTTFESGGEKVPTGEEIVLGYEDVRDYVTKAIENGRQDYLNQVKDNFLTAILDKDAVKKLNLKAEKDSYGRFQVSTQMADKLGLTLPKDENESSISYLTPADVSEMKISSEQLAEMDYILMKDGDDKDTLVKKNLENIYKFFSDILPEFRISIIKAIVRKPEGKSNGDMAHTAMARHHKLFAQIAEDIKNSKKK